MIYSVAEEFIQIFKRIDLDLNLGFVTSITSNQSLFKVDYYFYYRMNLDINILVGTISKYIIEKRKYIYLFYDTRYCSFVRYFI
jgi:hypothetical protein